MTIVIERPCYATREEVSRALDVKQVSYNSQQIDRQLVMASESVEDTTKRHFYPLTATYAFDWPNFQYAYPWSLWLNQFELAAQPSLVVTGHLLVTPVVIPPANYLLYPQSGPPYYELELRRDQNSSFGANSTPQLDIAITGQFGYWAKTLNPGVTLTASATSSTTTIEVSEGDTPGVGDAILVGTEQMVVQDKQPVATSVEFAAFTTASAADNVCSVPANSFFPGEIITCDTERMLVQQLIGTDMIVKRGWDGTILAEHTSGIIYADRQLTVTRGDLGTTAASYNNGQAVLINAIPGLVKQLAIAEAVVGLTQEPSAYAFDLEARSRTVSTVYGGSGHGQQREPAIGVGLTDLRDRVAARYGRQARTRVI